MTPRCQLLERRWPVRSSRPVRALRIAVVVLACGVSLAVSGCGLVPDNLPRPTLPKLSDLRALVPFGTAEEDAMVQASPSPSPSATASGEATPTPSALPDPTDCLKREVINLRINKDGGDYGFGGEIFVEFQVRFTNNCAQEVKAVEYEARFQDAFDDEIMYCFGKVTVKIPVGASKSSPKDTGCYVGAGEPSYQSWTVVSKADVTSEATVTRVVFKDGSISSRSVI